VAKSRLGDLISAAIHARTVYQEAWLTGDNRGVVELERRLQNGDYGEWARGKAGLFKKAAEMERIAFFTQMGLDPLTAPAALTAWMAKNGIQQLREMRR
jgi:hypothetical protein